MSLEIPFAIGVPLYTERVTLDGQEYTLRFDWNGREGRWYMSILLEDEYLVRGIKIISNTILLRRFVPRRRPKQHIMAVDFSSQGGEPPGFEDMGIRVRLIYG